MVAVVLPFSSFFVLLLILTTARSCSLGFIVGPYP